MTPDMIAALGKAGFEFGTELLKFWQTEQGKKAFEQMLLDRANWDAGWKSFTAPFVALFKPE